MPEHWLIVVQICSNFRGHMEWHRLKLPRVRIRASCLLWAKWTVLHLWDVFDISRVSVGACFLLRGFWRGKCFIGQLAATVEPGLEERSEGRLAGHISFCCEGWMSWSTQPYKRFSCVVLSGMFSHSNELCFSAVVTYLWQGLTIAPLTYARKLWAKMTSQKSLMEWMVWRIGCQSYGKKAL